MHDEKIQICMVDKALSVFEQQSYQQAIYVLYSIHVQDHTYCGKKHA